MLPLPSDRTRLKAVVAVIGTTVRPAASSFATEASNRRFVVAFVPTMLVT